MFDKTLTALRAQEQNHWQIGEALASEIKAGTDWAKLVTALEARGLEYKVSTLKAYQRVAKLFPAEDRMQGASFSAHQAALTAGDIADAKAALSRAKRNNGRATRDAVLNEVRQMKGRATGQTSDAVAAWRSLRAGVAKLIELDEAELDALLQIEKGVHAAEAADLSRDLTKVSTKISAALNKAESKGKTKTGAKAQAPTKTAKIKRLGAGRGE